MANQASDTEGKASGRYLGWLVLQWSAFVIAAAVLAGAVVLLYAPDASAYGLNSVALFSLAVSALAGALAIAIYRQQALQADRDASRHSRLLASIAQSASSAADSADRAHINTDAILRRLNAAQEVKTGNPISTDERAEVERAVVVAKDRGRRALLWVDDHREWIANEREAFEAAGVTVVWVPTTSHALALLDGNRFDVVITDMRRAEGADEGLVLLEAMRRRRDRTPVFVYTYPAGSGQVAYQHGAQGVAELPSQIFSLVMTSLAS